MKIKKILIIFVCLLLLDMFLNAVQVTDLKAFYRQGQTFITWKEEGEKTKIYRHEEKITKENIKQAKLLATINKGSGYWKREQKGFIIEDLGTPLSTGTGLFVYTVKNGGQYFYAVTNVNNSIENIVDFNAQNSLETPITEEVTLPGAVIFKKNASGYIFTHWMDYHNWNYDRDKGYAFNFHLTVPPNYKPETFPLLPVAVCGHGAGDNYLWGGFKNSSAEWDFVNYYCDENNQYLRIIVGDENCSWYFGYLNKEKTKVINYTEKRAIWMCNWLKSNQQKHFKVDPDRIYFHGSSMGGAGAVSLGLKYPETFAASYSLKGATIHKENGSWPGGLESDNFWGSIKRNLPTEEGIGVWDWQNMCWWTENNIKKETPFLVHVNGKLDTCIPWAQTPPFYKSMQKSKRPFIAYWGQFDHGMSTSALAQKARCPNYILGSFNLKRNESIPAFSNASCNNNPGNGNSSDGDKEGWINAYLEWSNSTNKFSQSIVDTSNRYEITIRLNKNSKLGPVYKENKCVVDITPRKLQQFQVIKGKKYKFQNVSVLNSQIVQEGQIFPDENELLTIEKFEVTKDGNRLIIEIINETVDKGNENLIKLHQNYPNPFNPESYIPYELKESGNVKVRIYNVLGQKVRELDLGKKAVGKYITKDKAAYWDGKDNKGKEAGSGIYYYELVVDGKVVGMKKSLVLK